MKEGGYDVVVVGGGLAGVAAACTAGRLGARTLLVDESVELGGNVSNAWVHTICGLFFADEPTEPRLVNTGFPARFARSLAAVGGARDAERVGRVMVVPISPERIGPLCASLCAESRVSVRVGTRVDAASLSVETRGGAELSFVDANGVCEVVRARVVIDASGEGAVAALAGAERLPPGPLSAPSLIVRLRGVGLPEITGFKALHVTAAVAQAARTGALPAGSDSVLLRPTGESGAAYLTVNLPPLPGQEYDPTDAGCMRELMAVAVERSAGIVAFLRATRPEFADVVIERWPRRIGVREARRVAGQLVIEEEHVLEGVRGDDDVALSAWPIELWSDHQRARFSYPKQPCGIPLGALRSRSHPELGMAGRCLSASHQAMGALRVLGTALATGEAVGAAAAIAASKNLSLRDVRPSDIRSSNRAKS